MPNSASRFGEIDFPNLPNRFRKGSVQGARGTKGTVWHLRRRERPLDELYDLKNDPGELTNLYRDPKHGEVRARLQQRLDECMKAIRDPMIRESQ